MPCGREALFLVQVLVDRAADHLALKRVRIHIAHRLAGLQKCSLPGSFTSRSSLSLRGADFADPAIGVDGALGQSPPDRRRPARSLLCG